ncbi:MAG: hypothetical protein OXI91_13750 [Chloroflexota bacterium]|nr:hypothetical protein [Chloroflexota bacterium]
MKGCLSVLGWCAAGFIIIVVILALLFGEEEAPDQINKPPLDVTTKEIYRAYQSNEARANVTYKNRRLNLEFKIHEVEDYYVIENLGPGGDWGSEVTAELTFPVEDLIEFNTGEIHTRECTLNGFQMDSWIEFDCK